MAMNLSNPIQLLRGTTAAIAAAQGKEGTLYYDKSRGVLMTKNTAAFDTHVRVFDNTSVSQSIYVNAVNGSDDNSGFSDTEPVKTIDKAFWLCLVRTGVQKPTIRLAAGTYSTDIVDFPDCIIVGSGIDATIIDVPYVKKQSGVLHVSDCEIRSNGVDPSNASITVFGVNFWTDNVRLNILSNCTTGIYFGDSSYGYMHNSIIRANNLTIGDNLISVHFGSCLLISTLELDGNITVNKAVVFSSGNSYVHITTGTKITATGTVTGSRYAIYDGAIIYSGGSGPNAIPGTKAGSVDSGGAYY